MSKWFHRSFNFVARLALPIRVLTVVLFAAPLVPLSFATGPEASVPVEPSQPADPGSPHISAVRSGMLETRDGLTLRLTTDLGSVKITQLEPGAPSVVRYNVHIETDARGSAAQQLLSNYSLRTRSSSSGVEITGTLPSQAARSGNAQFWVQFEVAVPRGYSVEVNTDGGDIATGDIGGTASLHTQGGIITTGKIGTTGLHEASRGRLIAKLETQGGHIQVQEVVGDLSAFTAGGHINVGNIAGDASLRTGGGHIRAGQIGGRAEFETAGGNITVAQAEKFVNVHTGGGQIDFGEVRGSVHAQTGGGGIRVMYVSGPMEVESSSGSICLTKVAGALQASTSGGTITAWINPDPPPGGGNVHLGGASQLASGNGDIIVFLPRNLAATIEATVVGGSERQIEADPTLHLNVQPSGNGSGQFHAMAVLNGGGAALKLRTTGGKIRLQYLDSEIALRESLIREQMERLNKRLKETGINPVSFSRGVGPTGPDQVDAPPQPGPTTLNPTPPPTDVPEKRETAKTDWLDSWLNNLELAWNGGMRENPDDFLKRFASPPYPKFPDLALRAGIHGRVVLQVRVTKDGRVEVQKVLEGEPVLADAAIDAVKRWRAKPGWLNGKKVEVISTVTFDFQLPGQR
jgi:TonB family protein